MRLRIFTEPQQGATYDDLLAAARTAEELGFDAFFRSDHYLRMGEGDAGPGPTTRGSPSRGWRGKRPDYVSERSSRRASSACPDRSRSPWRRWTL
jgi:alkanesulfonate monooxygenase SsuD/methylene tetrahydromethanopterin reductase-like flavin-dependent oxidoreductase (luciferase family)